VQSMLANGPQGEWSATRWSVGRVDTAHGQRTATRVAGAMTGWATCAQ